MIRRKAGAGVSWRAHSIVIPHSTLPHRVLECAVCGMVQQGPGCGPNERMACCRCRTPFAHRTWKSLEATLVCSSTLLILLAPALTASFITATALGATRTSVLPMSSSFLWYEGWPFLAIAVALLVLVFPVVRFGALTLVLVTLRTRARPRCLGAAFRI